MDQSEQIARLATELNEESDRALVILSASYIDHLLRLLITAELDLQDIPEAADKFLFEGSNAGLATFGSRILMAKHLGLVSKEEYGDLDRIRRIRNKFAHDFLGISFDTQQIRDLCNALKIAQIDGQPPTARERYLKAAIRFIVEIIRQTKSLESSE
jgi:hypothetical protein